MKRAAAVALLAAVATVGCESENEKPKKTSSDSSLKDTSKAASASTPAKTASAKEYYEVSKGGKSYVFGEMDAMLAFRSSGSLPAATIEKAAYGPKGETVVFQGGGMEAGLMAEYAKAHPKK